MELEDIITNIQKEVNLFEGESKIYDFINKLYYNREGFSNKELSQILLIPIPLVVAIKKEFNNYRLVKQEGNIKITNKGIELVEKYFEFDKIDKKFYQELVKENESSKYFTEILNSLKSVMELRPLADFELDQAKCTEETALKRVILAMKYNSIFAKDILCLGDDDFISVNISKSLEYLTISDKLDRVKINVFDIDKRILEDIKKSAGIYEINVKQQDLQNDIDKSYHNRFDTIFLDPPYTFNGLETFLSRAVQLINKDKKNMIFLSFINKGYNFNYKIQKKIIELGLVIEEIINDFNEYESAQILGYKSQMIVLSTTENTKQKIEVENKKEIYTGQINKTERKYRCKNCNKVYTVGINKNIKNIEKLKEIGCSCGGEKFLLIKRKKVKK